MRKGGSEEEAVKEAQQGLEPERWIHLLF